MEVNHTLNWSQYAKTARAAAAEGAVLLKNDCNALPLTPNARISIFGRIQFSYYKSGTGSGGMVNTKYVMDILSALKQEKCLWINPELEEIYRTWIKDHPYDEGNGWGTEPWCQEEMPLTNEIVENAANVSDTAVMIIGRTAGEDRDASEDEGSYLLTALEKDMLAKVCKAFKKTVVLLNVGNIIDMKWVREYNPSAVMYVWQGGMEGGNGVADLLMGRVSPSGKLTDTIAENISDYPSNANFGDDNRLFYAEDIYVGYRWFETFAPDKVIYPFGFGLSYSQFQITCKESVWNDQGLELTASVVNIGDFPGKEVVQVYGLAPQGKLGKPSRVLLGFGKTDVIAPGKKAVLSLSIPKYRFSSFDDSGITGHPHCYVMEEGKYEVWMGGDVRKAHPVYSFELKECEVVEQLNQAAAPVLSFDRIRPSADDKGNLTPVYEPVPLRTIDIKARINNEMPETIPYTGDCSIKLADVFDGKAQLDDFIAQLSDFDLICLARGEGMCSPKVTPGTAAAFGGVSDALKGFGIPCGCCSDGPSGIRMDCGSFAFSLPNGTCMACTFNEALNEELFSYLGMELRKNHIDTLLGPGMNIHRHPLNGRNFEYFSEDPLVSGKIAAAQLKGMHRHGVTGTIKHFCGNNQEHRRHHLDSVISQRALREIYLKGFEIAVKEAGAYSIMTTYGALNGQWTGSHYDLVTTILRNEWGFQGIAMTDWWAALNDEGEKPSIQNTAAMIRAQNDVYMVTSDSPGNGNKDNLEEAVKAGSVTRGQLQKCARNTLKVLLRSPAMLHFLGRLGKEEEESAAQLLAEEKEMFADLPMMELNDELRIDSRNAHTGKGAFLAYGLRVKDPGEYQMLIEFFVESKELSQIPVSIYVNGRVVNTFTFNGLDKSQRIIEKELGFLNAGDNYIKMFFAQAGFRPVEFIFKRK